MDENEILDAFSLAVTELRKEHAAAIDALRTELSRALEARPTEAAFTLALETLAGQVDGVARQAGETAEALAAQATAALDKAQAAQAAATQVREDLLEGFTLSKDRDDALQAQLAERFASLPAPVVQEAVDQAILEALAPVSAALDAQAQRLDAHEDRVTEARLREALAPMIETLAKHEDNLATEEQVREALAPILESLVDLDTALGETRLAASNALTEAVAPLRDDIATLHQAIDTQVTGDQLSASLASVTGALTAVADRVETKIAAADLQAAVAPLQQAQEALDAEIRTRATLAHVEGLMASLEAAAAGTQHAVSGLTDAALAFEEALDERVTVDQLAQVVEGVVDSVSSRLLERYQKIEPWAQGGAGYQPFALVQHRGALWQATTRTHDEPAVDSSRWALLTDAVASLTFERRVPGYITLVTRYVSGAPEMTLDVREPVPVFRGVYSPSATYTTWDSVAKDSHVFLCLVDAPTGGPGEVLGEWQITSGPRGRKGKDAPEVDERALVLQVMREVVPQLQQAVDLIAP